MCLNRKRVSILIVICTLSLITTLFIGCSQQASAASNTEKNPLFAIRQNGKVGYIDKKGEIVITPQFDTAWPFSEGLALIEDDGKYGYIDKKGEIVITPQFDYARSFSEGLALIKDDGKYGYDR